MKTRKKFTPETATQFEGEKSPANIAMIEAARATRASSGVHAACDCKAYESVFTYNRWRGLGYQVQKGEKALTKVLTILEKEDGSKRPWFAAVFCRCQVKLIDEAAPVNEPEQAEPEPVAVPDYVLALEI